jgi:predicted membrane protein DUF2142
MTGATRPRSPGLWGWLRRIGPETSEGLAAARPRFLPETRWARVALIALLAFTLLRGVLWGLTTPSFWAPDEDYHFLYAEYLTTQHALISPKKPLYPKEYPAAVDAIDYNAFCCGPRRSFSGDPKASIKRLARLPHSARDPVIAGRGVGVVHPPLYQGLAAILNWSLDGKSILTRLTWIRFMTAAFGVLAVLFAWVLAAQVLPDPRLQLLSALLVAVQPMLGYLSGIVNHDMALVAFFTAALAVMAFMLRTPPRAAQGAWLGAFVLLALLVKGSAAVLVPLAALTYLAQGLVYRERWREIARSVGLAALVAVPLVGAWYVRARIVYGSSTGAVGNVLAGGSGEAHHGLGDMLRYAKEWTGLVYRTYWWHYQPGEGPGPSFAKYVPAFFGALGAVGLSLVAWSERRSLLAAGRPLLRQSVILVAAALALYLSFLGVDVTRRADGGSFLVVGGRYLLPAFPAVAVLFVVGLRALIRPAAQPLVFVVVAAAAVVFGIDVYMRFYAHRYFGDVGIGEFMRRLSFDRPEFVTRFSLSVLLVLLAASLIGFVYAVARVERPQVAT